MSTDESTPTTPQHDEDDAEAHMMRPGRLNDDVPTEKPVAGQAPDQDGPDDVEGHGIRGKY